MQYGDIIELGRHRLMYGDATNARDVAALAGDREIDLVLTDPPYGMKCQHKDGHIGGDRDSGFLGKWTPAKRYRFS